MANDLIIDLYMKSKEAFNKFESTPRDFGTGDLLYSSEIHTLVEISKNQGTNLTELADQLNISKSGTSKFINKLLSKKLINKSKEVGNKKEVLFTLTNKGSIAVNGHYLFRKETFSPILKLIDELSDADKKVMIHFLENLNSIINHINNLN